MKLPICIFDAKNLVLCPRCESKIQSGKLTKADIEASMSLAKIVKLEKAFDSFTLHSCREIGEDFILSLEKNDIMTVRQSHTLYGMLQEQFKGKIWLVEAEETDSMFIDDMLFPIKVSSINKVWMQDGVNKTKVVISGRWTPKFPIDTEKIIKIVKDIRNLDIEIEFEDKR